MNTFKNPCVIWRITDGKRGHERQTQGLAQALAAILQVRLVDIACESGMVALWHWLLRRFPAGKALSAPDLIIGAGHGTHLTMLAAKRAFGGKTVVLMKPSLPLSCFDLCLLPEHDGGHEAANVLTTRGALNAVACLQPKQPQQGLMLIGGVSAHYHWDEAAIVQQVKRIAADTATSWTLATSPRTPSSTLNLLRQCGNVRIMPFQQADADWLPEKIARVAQVWVTPDSVSMVYEACTSGAAVGLLQLPEKPATRVTRGLQALATEGRVTLYDDWLRGKPLASPAEKFNEAARCAARIKQLWF
jgi:mitochondrial fission protein ELM1